MAEACWAASNRACLLGGPRPIARVQHPTVSDDGGSNDIVSHQSRAQMRVRCASNAGHAAEVSRSCFIDYNWHLCSSLVLRYSRGHCARAFGWPFPTTNTTQKKYIQIHDYAVYGAPSPKRPLSRPKGILNIGAAIIDNSMQSKPLGYNHNNLIKPSHPAMLELHHTKSDSSSMLSSEAIAPKHQAKAKKGKTSSQITRSRSPLFWRDQDFSIEFG